MKANAELMEILEAMVKNRYPEAEIEIDPPEDHENPWFFSAYLNKKEVYIEWWPELGFGVSLDISDQNTVGFGEGPDNIIDSPEGVFNHISNFFDLKEDPIIEKCQIKVGNEFIGQENGQWVLIGNNKYPWTFLNREEARKATQQFEDAEIIPI